MANAKWFSTLNENQGYWQIPLDEESQLLTTFNTQFSSPDDEKVQAIKDKPAPTDKKGVETDKKGVERLLGPVNYLGKFIPNLATVTEPVRVLL